MAMEGAFGIPPDVDVPIVPPPEKAGRPRSIELADFYTTMADYSNLALDLSAEEFKENSYFQDTTTGLMKVYKDGAKTAAKKAKLTYDAAGDDAFDIPNDLSAALTYLKIAWPPAPPAPVPRGLFCCLHPYTVLG